MNRCYISDRRHCGARWTSCTDPLLALPCALALVYAAACGDAASSSTTAAPRPTQARAALIEYPMAAWRNDPASLNQTALAVAHILIAHRGSDPADDPGQPRSTFHPHTARTRSRAEALELGLYVRESLTRGSASFAALAERYSDEPASAALGGQLGIVPATSLPARYLDALDAIEVDQPSELFESPLGFHVVKRVPLPEAAELSPSGLLIKYAGTAGQARPGLVVTRTRAEARAEIERLSLEARRAPESFPNLVRAHGEQFNAEAGGALGPWSNREPFGSPPALYELQRLQTGQISRVYETVEGFWIYRRDQERTWATYAASRIIIAYGEPEEDGTPARSRAQALELIDSVLRELGREPGRFDALRAQYCDLPDCAARTFREAREERQKEEVVAALAVGQIADRAVESGPAFSILRREDPALFRASFEWRHELPQPAPVDLEVVVKGSSPEQLSGGLQILAKLSGEHLELAPAKRQQLGDLLESVAAELASTPPEQRVAVLQHSQNELRALLGPVQFAEFQLFRRKWLADHLRYKE